MDKLAQFVKGHNHEIMAGRKPKRPEDRMTDGIRIPLTPKQKRRVDAFREGTGHDIATWVRAWMLREVEEWEGVRDEPDLKKSE